MYVRNTVPVLVLVMIRQPVFDMIPVGFENHSALARHIDLVFGRLAVCTRNCQLFTLLMSTNHPLRAMILSDHRRLQ